MKSGRPARRGTPTLRPLCWCWTATRCISAMFSNKCCNCLLLAAAAAALLLLLLLLL
jgi:hypothetical protein